MTNLIKNGDFSQGYEGHVAYKYPIGGEMVKIMVPEITNAKYWETFFVHGLPVPWDEDNLIGFAQPEVRLATAVPDPNRIMPGTTHSQQGFGFYKIIDCGHLQKVSGLTPGKKYVLRGYAHAWSSLDDTARTSEVCGSAGYYGYPKDVAPGQEWLMNHNFCFGVDLNGSIDIQAAMWNPEVNIYNKFHALPELEFTATGSAVTVFIRDTVLWAAKHNDYYWSQISLEEVNAEPPVEPPVEPPTDYEYPVIETGTKLADHGIGDNGMLDAIYDRMQRGVFTPVCKSVASVGVLKDVKILSPDTITIGRYMEGIDGDLDEEGPPLDGDLKKTAEKLMASFMPKWEKDGTYVDYWEIINEQDPPGIDGHVRLATLLSYCIDIADANGYKLALFSYSRGVPEINEWEAIINTGIFAKAKAGGHILSLHEYASPTNLWYGQPIPGAEQRDDAGPLCTRYRFLYELLKEKNQVIPLVITEFNTTQDLRQQTGEDWVANMAWYDNEIAKDYYVLGATIFTLAGSGIWPDFNYLSKIKYLEDHMVSVKDRQNGPAPTDQPPVEPPTECDKPRISYERTYVLIPPDHGFEWIEATGDVWNEFRFGIGGSADDSAYGPGLAKRVVLALNPEAWPGDLAAFVDEFYAGAKLHEIYANDPEDFANQLWIYYHGETELVLTYPTTHMPPVITSNYGDTIGRVYPHNGVDFRSSWNLWQDQVVCALSGTVTFVGVSASYGNHIIVRSNVNGQAVDLRYAHLVYGGQYVSQGELVVRGQYLGRPDNTGSSTADHLHFDMKIDGVQVNPTPYIEWPEEYIPPTGGTGAEIKGVHSAPIAAQVETGDQLVAKLKELGMKWFKILTDGNPANITLCSKLIANGIQPVVRLYTHEQFPDSLGAGLIDHAKRLVDVGVKYFEIGNEPNLPGEWKSVYKNIVDFKNPDIIRLMAEAWVTDAKSIISIGGKPGLYAMAPTDVNGTNEKYSSVKWVGALYDKIKSLWSASSEFVADGDIWLAAHSAAFSRPFDFDPFANMDDMCLRSYELYASIARASFGVQRVDVISTEGGVYSPEHMEYIGWHDYDYTEETWGGRVVDMYKFLGKSKGILAMCPWTFSDVGADKMWWGSGWYNKDNNPRSPIVALKGDLSD